MSETDLGSGITSGEGCLLASHAYRDPAKTHSCQSLNLYCVYQVLTAI